MSTRLRAVLMWTAVFGLVLTLAVLSIDWNYPADAMRPHADAGSLAVLALLCATSVTCAVGVGRLKVSLLPVSVALLLLGACELRARLLFGQWIYVDGALGAAFLATLIVVLRSFRA